MKKNVTTIKDFDVWCAFNSYGVIYLVIGDGLIIFPVSFGVLCFNYLQTSNPVTSVEFEIIDYGGKERPPDIIIHRFIK